MMTAEETPRNGRRLDGGPAFPFVSWRAPDGMIAQAATGGMSLRDWFAGHALITMGEANPDLPGSPANLEHWPKPYELASRRACWA